MAPEIQHSDDASGDAKGDPITPPANLRESEHFLKRIAEVTPNVVHVFDLVEKRSVFINRSVAATLGYSPEEVHALGDRVVPALMHPDDLPRFELHMAAVRALADDESADFEHRMRDRAGRWRWFQSRDAVFARTATGAVRQIIGAAVEITDRKRAEEALKESELRFRHIADAAPVLIWISDTGKKCVWFNKVWLEFTGRTMDQEQGDGWTQGVHPDDLEKCLAIYETAFDARTPFEMEYRLRHRDGDYRWLLDKGVPRVAPDGEFSGFIGSCSDITAHKHSDAAHATSQRQLQTVLASITDGLAVLNKDWRYTFINEAGARIIGARPEELLGRCVWDLYPDAKGTAFEAGYRRAVETGRRVELEEYYPEPIGKWLECHCYPSAEGLSVYFHDVSARKRSQETRAQNESLFRTLIEQAPMGVYAVDAEFRLRQVNTQAMPVFANVRPLLGRDFREILEVLWGPEVGGRCASIFRRTLGSGERYVSPPFTEMRHDLGMEQTFEWETQRVTMPDGRLGVVCYFHEVTERERTQTALRASETALRGAQAELQKYAAELEARVSERTRELLATTEQLETFVYSIAHDLRAPLRSMMGYAQLLTEDLGPAMEPGARQMLERILKSSQFMDRLLLDLLAFGSIAGAKMELAPVKVQEAWEAALFHCADGIDKSGAQIETVQPLPTVRAHQATLVQCLSNVLGNALKFVAPGVRPSIRFWSEDKSGKVRLWVQDNGIGISQREQERVFRVFERLHGSRYEGTGIGLSIVRKGIDRMGGDAGLESKPGQGTRFWVELPVGKPASHP